MIYWNRYFRSGEFDAILLRKYPFQYTIAIIHVSLENVPLVISVNGTELSEKFHYIN